MQRHWQLPHQRAIHWTGYNSCKRFAARPADTIHGRSGRPTAYLSARRNTSAHLRRTLSHVLVTVKPEITVSPQVDTICSSQTFTVTPTGAGIPAGAPQLVCSGLCQRDRPVAAGTNAQATSAERSVTRRHRYRRPPNAVTPTATICPGNNFTVTIYVNPAPQVTFNPVTNRSVPGRTVTTVTISSATAGVNIPGYHIPCGNHGCYGQRQRYDTGSDLNE